MAKQDANGMESMMSMMSSLGTGPVSVEPCVSPQYFEAEKEKIFKRTWLNIGREDDIPKPGDFFRRDLCFLKTSIVVVRGRDGVVRSFYNICRHRGHDVAIERCGNTKGFACPFHGWTYDTQGLLAFVPHEQTYFDLKKEESGLIPVATDTWKGYIFVNLDPRPAQTLREQLGEIVEVFTDYPLEAMRRSASYAGMVKGNWKIYADAFKDPAHVEYIHKRSLPDAFPTIDKMSAGGGGMIAGGVAGRNSYGLGFGLNPEHKPSRAEALAYKYRNTGLTVIDPPDDGLSKGKFKGVSNITLFPNFLFALVHDGFYFTHRFLPRAVDETYFEFELYMEPPKNAAEKISQEYTTILSRDGMREDLVTMERIHRNLSSGAMKDMILGLGDTALRLGYRVVDEAVRG